MEISVSESTARHLCLLPTELLLQVLGELDYRSLVRCKQVCRLFLETINNAVALQYKIELGVARMEDGPPSLLGAADRLALLKRHQQAWNTLKYSSIEWMPMLRGEVWELYGDVLAQARGSKVLCFWQLPSAIRGIEHKEWTLENFEFVIRDFGMDPAQDLLVLIQSPRADSDDPYRIHLRHLSSGDRHTRAPNPAIFTHSPHGSEDYSFTIQVAGDLLGVLFINHGDEDAELLVWNWKTGVRICRVIGEGVRSFAFLTPRHVLLAETEYGTEEGDTLGPTLFVIDVFKHADTNTDILVQSDDLCRFRLPELSDLATDYSVLIRSDPAPGWTPHPDSKVPFYTGRHDRLFVLTLDVVETTMHLHALLMFVPSSTFTSRMDALAPGEEHRAFDWEDWGPTGTRLIRAPPRQTHVWVCYVFGMKFAFKRMINNNMAICVLDFNLLPVKRRQAEGRDGMEPGLEERSYERTPTTLPGGTVFKNPVTTSLPFRSHTLMFEVPSQGGPIPLAAVMLSEDSLIMVADLPNVRQFGIITY
ncbi:hypothetical protein OBBRIDRAFT_743996 [Obba rivulosa]|uniref:F-box domain-containing protein n=1 Tax=Obba rivulosa TaxID=1052685 RepID=A0A8E2DUF9_9APHY|nr:hypothetical protein OBBRIDRAFT_743996 [Obba rivulosa]